MSERVIPDRDRPGAFLVMFGDTAQSWVDPRDPLHLEFEYVQRIAEALDLTVLSRPADERVRVVHIGGAAMMLPRYVEARRPRSAQIVLEPDVDLVDEVRRRLPLPRQSGIKIRPVGGREGVTGMPGDYADCVILDAFAGARVPAELTTAEFLGDVASRLRPGHLFAANITDKAPFGWARRFLAGVCREWAHVQVSAEPAVWKGRRFGNLVVLASDRGLPTAELEQFAHRSAFPARTLAGRSLSKWLGGAEPWTDADAEASPQPPGGRSWFS